MPRSLVRLSLILAALRAYADGLEPGWGRLSAVVVAVELSKDDAADAGRLALWTERA